MQEPVTENLSDRIMLLVDTDGAAQQSLNPIFQVDSQEHGRVLEISMSSSMIQVV